MAAVPMFQSFKISQSPESIKVSVDAESPRVSKTRWRVSKAQDFRERPESSSFYVSQI